MATYLKKLDARLHRDMIDHPPHLDATKGDELRSMDLVFLYREEDAPRNGY
jgi:hypothetical protein